MNLNYLKMPPCHFDLLTCSLQIEAQPKDKINGELMCAKRMQWYLRVCVCVCVCVSVHVHAVQGETTWRAGGLWFGGVFPAWGCSCPASCRKHSVFLVLPCTPIYRVEH